MMRDNDIVDLIVGLPLAIIFYISLVVFLCILFGLTARVGFYLGAWSSVLL